MSGNKPFAGPRVALPSHFPKSFRNSQPDNPCRYLISKLLDQSISSSDFFTQLLSIKNENREISFSILNCLLFYILNCKPYHSQFCPQFTALFTKLIQNSSEPVRRSVLPLISILINNNQVLKSLSNEFSTWKDESKEIFLSFAFCFQPPEVFEWKPFLSNAQESTKSENESLSCTANDFIEYMNYFLGNDKNEPKVRNSLDLTKEQFRRSMSFRTSMDFNQIKMDEIENDDENEEINDIEFESSDKFAIDNYQIDSSSTRSSHNSDIPSLRVSRQKGAMEELENDPFNKKSPFFDSIENDQDVSNFHTNESSKESESLEESSSISSRKNKPQVIESVDLSKMKKENTRKSSKILHHSNPSSNSKSTKTTRSSKSSKNKSTSSSIEVDIEIDDTNVEINDIDFDDRSVNSNSSSNLSGILDEFDIDLPSQVPKNLSPQKVNTQTSIRFRSETSQSRSSKSHNDDANTTKPQSQSPLITDISEKTKTQKKNGRTNQSSAEPQTIKSSSKSKSSKSSLNNQKVHKSNDYGQSSEGNSDDISFTAQPARPPSARRGRQNNSSSDISSIPTKKGSHLNFVDTDAVEDGVTTSNSGNRIKSNLSRKSKNSQKPPNEGQIIDHNDTFEDDDDYSEGLFGAAPDYENKVTFGTPPIHTKKSDSITSHHTNVSSSVNNSSNNSNSNNNRQPSKKKLPQKSEKSGNSKTMSPVKKRPDSRASNSSTESLPSSSSKSRQQQQLKRGSPSSPSNSFNEDDLQQGNVYSLVTSLANKDWEEQQKGVEGLREYLDNKPGLVSSYCREVWMNLLDVIVSPRTMLSNAALKLASDLFTQFSPQLVSQTAPFVDICLNLVCNSRQFIAEAAENVIILIAQESPRSKAFNLFIKGTGHKNSIARGKAAQCLAILVEQGPLDDREFRAVVQCLAPLVRDNRTETRFAAKETLKLIAGDDRFRDVAKDICKNSLDFNELMKSVEV